MTGEVAPHRLLGLGTVDDVENGNDENADPDG